ncbi:MAG: DNA mismatch endonuclease Vsr [Opitutae bacterium]|nr:DNA mismatch endonuclease Vsr [Opitutae bacterium]
MSPKARSRHMAKIRSRDTKPELAVRRALRLLGFKFRSGNTTVARLPGRPDFVLSDRATVLFVHGCFWHRHMNCAANRTPKTNIAFWRKKFAGNIARDRKATRELRRLGWRVLTLWECQTGSQNHLLQLLDRKLAAT